MKMVDHEGILVSWDPTINASAAGADRKGDHLHFLFYLPSDTGRVLTPGTHFTYSLCSGAELFYRAALTGTNAPDHQELEEDELAEKDGYIYPNAAEKVFFCEVASSYQRVERDVYGSAPVKVVEAKIKDEIGKGKGLTREDPLIEAMVHASRMHVADAEQKKELKEKIFDALDGKESPVASDIREFVEGNS